MPYEYEKASYSTARALPVSSRTQAPPPHVVVVRHVLRAAPLASANGAGRDPGPAGRPAAARRPSDTQTIPDPHHTTRALSSLQS